MKCLLRLVSAPAIRRWNPLVICAEEGFLIEECTRRGVASMALPFPSSRSLPGLLFLNSRFARSVVKRLRGRVEEPAIVQANDHPFAILADELARRLAAKKVVFLQSSSMRGRDYLKYRCHTFHKVFPVGDDLAKTVFDSDPQADGSEYRPLESSWPWPKMVADWDPRTRVIPIWNALEPDEFREPAPICGARPQKILVVGSPHPGKGWADVLDALAMLEKEKRLPDLGVDFLGGVPTDPRLLSGAGRLVHAKVRFLPRTADFRSIGQQYPLAIHPSRAESFGMAAVELLALGIPLISSDVGIIPTVLTDPQFVYRAQNVQELADRLDRVLALWPDIAFDARSVQGVLRARFSVDNLADVVSRAYDALFAE